MELLTQFLYIATRYDPETFQLPPSRLRLVSKSWNQVLINNATRFWSDLTIVLQTGHAEFVLNGSDVMFAFRHCNVDPKTVTFVDYYELKQANKRYTGPAVRQLSLKVQRIMPRLRAHTIHLTFSHSPLGVPYLAEDWPNLETVNVVGTTDTFKLSPDPLWSFALWKAPKLSSIALLHMYSKHLPDIQKIKDFPVAKVSMCIILTRHMLSISRSPSSVFTA